MANLNGLQRYDLVGGYYPTMAEMKDGDYLKFGDVKELLNTTTNSAMVPCEKWSAGGFSFAESCGWKFCPVCGVSLAQHK